MAYKTSIIAPAGGKLNLDDDIFLLPQNDTSYRINCISTEPGCYNSITNVRGFKGFNNISLTQRIPVYRVKNEYDIFEYHIPIYEDLSNVKEILLLKIRWRRYNSQIIDQYTISFYNVSDFWNFLYYTFNYWYNTFIKNKYPEFGYYFDFNNKYFMVYFETDYFDVCIEPEISINSLDVVGGVEDIEEDTLYIFSRSENGSSFIHRFNQQTEVFDTILASFKTLNLQYDNKIDAHVVGSGDEKMLIWTDGVNPPRKLLVNKALRTNSMLTGNTKLDNEDIRYFRLTDEELYVGAIPPSIAPTYTYGSDANYKINDIRGKIYQFAYRYIYDDDSISVWSDLSPVTYPSDEEGLNFTFINDITKNNYIQIKYFVPYNVKGVELGYRVVDIGNSNVGNFYAFKIIENKSRFFNRYEYQRFNGNEQAYPISDEELNKLYDYIPHVARNQEVIKDTILVYGDIDEGLDSIKPNVTLNVENNSVEFNVNKTVINSTVQQSPYARITLDNDYGVNERFFVIKLTNKGIRLDTNKTNDEFIIDNYYIFLWNSQFYYPNANSIVQYINNFNLPTNRFCLYVISPQPPLSWFNIVPSDWDLYGELYTPDNDYSDLMDKIHQKIDYYYKENSFNGNKSVTKVRISNKDYYAWDYQLMNFRFDLYQIASSSSYQYKLFEREHDVLQWGKYYINFNNIFNKPFVIIKLIAGVDFYSYVYNGETCSEILNDIASYFNYLGYDFSVDGNTLIFTHNNKLWHRDFYVEYYEDLYKNSTLSKNERHYFSLAYRDKYGRISYGNEVIEIVNNLKYFENGINLGKLKYTIRHKPPEYAVSYLWLYGGSNVIDKHVYYFNKDYVTFDWKYTYFDFDRIIVELSEMIENYNETTQEITESAIIRILGIWNGNTIIPFSKEYVFDILGKDADGRMYTSSIENETEIVDALNNNNELVCEVSIMRRGDKDNLIFYHTGLEYPIINGFHYGSVQNQTSSQPAIGYLPFTNSHLHFTVVRNNLYALIESRKYSFIYNSKVNNFGKLNIIQTNVKRDRYIKLRYGGRFYHDAEYNYMFSFDADAEKWLNKDNGAIVAMIMRGDTLRVYQNKKACSIYLSATMAMSPDGNEIMVQVKDILGYIRENSEDYGSFHPFSFAKDEQYIYFFDANNMDLIRDTVNGFHPLGLNFKCKSFFVDIIKNGIDNYKIVGGIDPQTKMYYLTFKNTITGESKTIGFNELFNRFEGFYSFYPDIYISTVNNLYSTIYSNKNAFIYKHNSLDVYNKFYDNNIHSTELDIICNELPVYNKIFYAVGVHSNLMPDSSGMYDVVVYERDNNQRISLIPQYEYKEDVWRADILRDMSDLENQYFSLYNGRQMKGGVGKIRIKFNSQNKLVLRFVEVNYLHQL